MLEVVFDTKICPNRHNRDRGNRGRDIVVAVIVVVIVIVIMWYS